MTTDPNDATRPLTTERRHSQERTIGQLIAQATQDVSVIVRKEIELAKSEITSQLGVAGKGAALLVVAGVIALYALGLLLVAIAFVLVALGLPIWAGFLIVSVVLFVVTGILALVGRRVLQRVSPRPDRAIANAQETIAAVRGSMASGSAHAKAVPAPNAQVALDARSTSQ